MVGGRNLFQLFGYGTANMPPPTDEMPVAACDALFDWQLHGNNFAALDADSLVQAQICGRSSTYRKVGCPWLKRM